MKNKKNLPNREKLAILKKKENATLIAGFSLALVMVGSIPLTFAASIPFEKKVDAILEDTGYNAYVDEKMAEYEKQYNNHEIPKEVYSSYEEYYGKTDAVREYYESIGDEENLDKVEGLLKSRQAVCISICGIGILSAFSGLACIMESRMKEAEIYQLTETMQANGESFEYDPNANLDKNFVEIFPDFKKKDDEDENEESK